MNIEYKHNLRKEIVSLPYWSGIKKKVAIRQMAGDTRFRQYMPVNILTRIEAFTSQWFRFHEVRETKS